MSLKQRRGESIAFMSEKDLEVSEDFNLETAEEDEVEEEIAEISEIVELLKPEEKTVEETTEEEPENTEMEITENDMQHVNRMDRRVRRKLEWLIDKRGKKEET
jgi:hypothetical protein